MRKVILFLFLAVVVFSMSLIAINRKDYNEISSLGDFRYVNDLLYKDNILYVATNNGIARYNTDYGKWLMPITELNYGSSEPVEKLKEDNWNVYFYADKWYKIDTSFKEVSSYSFSIKEYDGDLRDDPKNYFDKNYFEGDNFAYYDATSMVYNADKTKAYVGTYGNGVYEFDLQIIDIRNHYAPLYTAKNLFGYIKGNEILFSKVCNNYLWVFTKDEDLGSVVSIINLDDDKYYYLEEKKYWGLSFENVNDIIYVKDEYFIATESGLLVINKKFSDVDKRKFTSEIYTILSINDKETVLYLGTDRGIYKYFSITETFTYVNTDIQINVPVNDLIFWDGNIFGASDYGVFKFDFYDYKITQYKIGDISISAQFLLSNNKGVYIAAENEIYYLAPLNEPDKYGLSLLIPRTFITFEEITGFVNIKSKFALCNKTQMYFYNQKENIVDLVDTFYGNLKNLDFLSKYVVVNDRKKIILISESAYFD